MNYNKIATSKLNNLKRISFKNIDKNYEYDVLLYEGNSQLFYNNDKIYQIDGNNLKDLLRIIKIKDPLNLQYENTNILVPRVVAESHNPIPQHISVQCLFFHKLSLFHLKEIKEIILSTKYNKTLYDSMWIGHERSLSSIKENDFLYLMNRRIGGWDGSIEKPVIELLCSGGHISTIWDEQTRSFKTLNHIELLVREVSEELRISISPEKIIQLGGFHNEVSNELVILCALFVNYNQLIDIINRSKGNISENTDGIYIGLFQDVMNLYNLHPDYFAGGKKAKNSNFPSNHKLMKKIEKILK